MVRHSFCDFGRFWGCSRCKLIPFDRFICDTECEPGVRIPGQKYNDDMCVKYDVWIDIGPPAIPEKSPADKALDEFIRRRVSKRNSGACDGGYDLDVERNARNAEANRRADRISDELGNAMSKMAPGDSVERLAALEWRIKR